MKTDEKIDKTHTATVQLSALPRSAEVVFGLIGMRSYHDRDFRNRLLANPKGTIIEEAKSFYREALPDEQRKKEADDKIDSESLQSVEINICRNTDKKWHIPLPNPNRRQLSEEEVAQVAGGIEIITVTAIGSLGTSIAVFGSTLVYSSVLFGSTAGVGTALAIAGVAGAAVAGVVSAAGVAAALALKYKK